MATTYYLKLISSLPESTYFALNASQSTLVSIVSLSVLLCNSLFWVMVTLNDSENHPVWFTLAFPSTYLPANRVSICIQISVLIYYRSIFYIPNKSKILPFSQFKPKAQCLTPVILATQEAEIRKIMVRSQPRQIVPKILSQKYPSQKGLLE
jgi:hypothetical protein